MIISVYHFKSIARIEINEEWIILAFKENNPPAKPLLTIQQSAHAVLHHFISRYIPAIKIILSDLTNQDHRKLSDFLTFHFRAEPIQFQSLSTRKQILGNP